MKDFDLARLAEIPDPLGPAPAGRAGDDARPVAAPAEGSPTRTDLRRRRALAIGFGILWMLCLVLAMGVATERFQAPAALVSCVLPGVVGFAALGLALSRGRAGLGPSARSAAVFLAGALVLFVVMCVATSSTAGTLAKDSWICGEVILVLGAVPLLAVAVAMRRTTPNRGVARSALLGGSFGLVAAGVQAMHCPKDELLHLVVGHGLPVVVLALVGVTIVRRLTSV